MAKNAVSDWSTTAASNTDVGGIGIQGSSALSAGDNALREMMKQVAAQFGIINFKGADIVAAGTTNLANATGNAVDITGTTTITAFGTVAAGQVFILQFDAALTLTHNATSLILPNGASILTTAGDIAVMISEGAGNWRCVSYSFAAGRGAFKRTVIVASTNAFQFDTRTSFADVEVVGGGGGAGGQTGASAAGSGAASAGGGAGGYSKKLITLTTAIRAATKTIVVGAGGVGSTTNTNTAGAASTYGDTVNSLSGGGGGLSTAGVFSTAVVFRVGGSGGAASGGDINIPGGAGGPGISTGSIANGATNAAAGSGNGGNSMLSVGPPGTVFAATSVASSGAGSSATVGGGGGGGACAVNAVGATVAGGNGGDGLVIITEYR